jgi:hypothetical protein
VRAPSSSEDPDERALTELRRARDLFITFIQKAGTDPAFGEAVARSKERIEDLDATIEFLEAGRRQRVAGPTSAP